MAKARAPRAGPKVYAKQLVIEVPKAMLEEAAQQAWPDLVTLAEGAGWRVRDTDDYLWCSKDHALLRQGTDEMRGIPVLLFQNW
jgi:hypothetical protein